MGTSARPPPITWPCASHTADRDWGHAQQTTQAETVCPDKRCSPKSHCACSGCHESLKWRSRAVPCANVDPHAHNTASYTPIMCPHRLHSDSITPSSKATQPRRVRVNRGCHSAQQHCNEIWWLAYIAMLTARTATYAVHHADTRAP
jgi:hypothetical protein